MLMIYRRSVSPQGSCVDCVFPQSKICPNDTVPDVSVLLFSKHNNENLSRTGCQSCKWYWNPAGRWRFSALVLFPAEISEEEKMYVNTHIWRRATADHRLQSHLPPAEHCRSPDLSEPRTQRHLVTGPLCVQVQRCCRGFFGQHCEPCPGPSAQPCFGNGLCLDGINGTGVCQCNKGFNGTACETCQSGRYGVHCDQGTFTMSSRWYEGSSWFTVVLCFSLQNVHVNMGIVTKVSLVTERVSVTSAGEESSVMKVWHHPHNMSSGSEKREPALWLFSQNHFYTFQPVVI